MNLKPYSVTRLRKGRSMRALAARLCTLMALVMLVTGCVTTKERGDRAFQAEHYNEALDHYERLIDEGNQDPQLFFKAAEAATRLGDLALAERYYSRALRYGGGEKVARALSEFYIQTSNYAKAVRVLQQLLETTDNPQPVFNNLGTALMYAGAPLDAESYLLVAQQMEPTDPVPYVNLGVLYDKHMNQPALALGFYKCFLKFADGSRRLHKVRTRAQRLEARYADGLPEQFDVECGQPYQPPRAASAAELRRRFEEATGASKEAEEQTEEQTQAEPNGDDEVELRFDDSKQPGDEPDVDAQPSPKESDDAPADDTDQEEDSATAQAPEDEADEPAVQGLVEGTPEELEQAARTEQKEDVDTAIEQAEQAFARKDYASVVDQLDDMPASKLDAHSMALYGRSLAKVGRHKDADRWLTWSLSERLESDAAEALFGVYDELGKEEARTKLCERLVDERFDELREQYCDIDRDKLRKLRKYIDENEQ